MTKRTKVIDFQPPQRLKILTIDDIPNCSVADRSILGLVTDDEVDLDQLAGMIQENPSLAALIIGLANSAYYSAPNSIDCVRDAIIKVLGMQMVRSVVLSMLLGKSLDLSNCPNFSVVEYWANCLTTARFCQMLIPRSQLNHKVSIDQIYLCGLLSGFGELLLIHHYPDEMNELIAACEGDLRLYIDSQQQILGVTQSEAGALIGKRWVLPEMVVNTMQHHLQPDYRGPDWEVCRIVGGVRLLVNEIQQGETELVFSEVMESVLTKPLSDCGLDRLPDLRSELLLIANYLTVTS